MVPWMMKWPSFKDLRGIVGLVLITVLTIASVGWHVRPDPYLLGVLAAIVGASEFIESRRNGK